MMIAARTVIIGNAELCSSKIEHTKVWLQVQKWVSKMKTYPILDIGSSLACTMRYLGNN